MYLSELKFADIWEAIGVLSWVGWDGTGFRSSRTVDTGLGIWSFEI